MQRRNIIKYLINEGFNLQFIIISFMLELIYFLIGYYGNPNNLIIYLKYFTILSIAYFFINLIANGLDAELLLFSSKRINSYLALLVFYLIFLVANSLIYFNLSLAIFMLNQLSLDYLGLVDYFSFSTSLFLVFLIIYTALKDKSIIFIIPLIILMFLLTGKLETYNYLFLKLSYNNYLYLDNSFLEIYLSLGIDFLAFSFIYFFRKQK